ncbi:hypothetical protein ACRRVD_01670 [Candidatus Cardinium hertigii]|uniref:hypothetical protein n=1 Tax=Candidatus Cardinium hertigii TaxID=247481 RepID=UPI003D7D1B5E
MPYKFNTLKSIKKGLIAPNILFPAAYLLFSAEVCTGSLKNKRSSQSANAPLLSLAAKPVDQLNTIEELSQFEDNPYWSAEWLSLNPCTRFSPAPVEGLPEVEEGTTKVPVEKPVQAPAERAKERSAEEVTVEPSAAVEEKLIKQVAASTPSLERGQEFDGVNDSGKTIGSKPTFNCINIKPRKYIELSLANYFPTFSPISNGLVVLDPSTDNRSVDQAMENDATKYDQEQKIIQEMNDRVSN